MQHTSLLSSLAQRTHARWSALIISLILLTLSSLSTSLASAQTYTYTTINLPWSTDGANAVTAITDMGKLAGTYVVSDIGPVGNWTWLNAKVGYQKFPSFKDKRLYIQDMNGSARTVGIYYSMKNGMVTGPEKAFTINSGTLTTLKLTPLVEVEHCSVNDAHDIVCTGWTAEDEMQSVRVKGSTPGVLEVYPSGVAILGINGARDIVGKQWDEATEKYRGYYRHAATGEAVLIDAPCGRDTAIVDVNLSSTLAAVTCGRFDGSESPPISYAFNGMTWTELHVPGAFSTTVRRLNNAGQFVGMYVDSELDWDHHGFVAMPVFGQPIAQR